MPKVAPYALLPFQFCRRPSGRILLVNEAGENLFIDNERDFDAFVHLNLPVDHPLFESLFSRHFCAITSDSIATAVELTAAQYRTRKLFLDQFTTLHMFVVTVRCNSDCKYCQVLSEAEHAEKLDMSIETAEKAVEFAMSSPASHMTIEIQGGEPLLNWNVAKAIVQKAEALNASLNKALTFVVCTNLTLINRDHLEFCRNHNVQISTSLDGPPELHSGNRPLRSGCDSFSTFNEKLNLAREVLGVGSVSALMTTTRDSLVRLREIVDKYISMGFNNLFIRPLNPYGQACRNATSIGYSTDEFLDAYSNALRYIININKQGVYFQESYASLLLSRILTPLPTGFVDLQSPTGAGISGIVYDYDGGLYPADEGRMLARQGDKKFLLGNVYTTTFREALGGDKLRQMVSQSLVETVPGCAYCAYQSYCGADPIRNYVESGEYIGCPPTSSHCRKTKRIINLLFDFIEANDPETMAIFWSWIYRLPVSELMVPRRCVGADPTGMTE